MRKKRQEKILELIKKQKIHTQKSLARLLEKEGFHVTQATVSRDIRDLNIIKKGSGGNSFYAAPPGAERGVGERFGKILRNTVQNIKASENLIVINTLSGCANAAAEAIDTGRFPEIIGTLAGDNTILLIINSKKDVPRLMSEFEAIIK